MEARKVCLFCKLDEDNELLYGKIYELDGDIVAHYFCLLLSSNVEQNGGDNDGILGFLREDILKEYRRGKRLTCWYCKKSGATVGCCMSRCKKVFHLPCGRREGSLHQFFGQFKSFCASHRPAQKISGEVLLEVDKSATCTICCDDVHPRNCLSTLWAPCCSSNAWFHRDCVQRLALSAGYFFKCPLCNNKTIFQKAMLDFGIYIPEQDAAWELEPNAFQDLLHRHNRCDAKHCVCPEGRSHAMVGTRWELVLCRYCGAQGIHVGCGDLKWSNPEWECDECTVMLQQAQEWGDTDSDEERDPSPASVNQVPAKRKRSYFKGSGRRHRAKYRKQCVLNSSPHPHPSSSEIPVMPEGGPSALTDDPVSSPTPIAVIEVSDDDIIEIDDDDDDDDDDEPPGKTSTPSNDRMILSCDGKAIPVIPVTSFAESDNGQTFCVVGDLDVKFPCHLYDMQQVAQPAASNREIANISGAMVPGSSVDSRKSLHSSVDGSSSSRSVHSSAAFSHSDQPPASGTARGNLLKLYLTSENAEGGCAYPAQVPTVASHMDVNTPARTESWNPNTCRVQHSAPSTSSQKAAVVSSSRVCNRPHEGRCDQEHGSCISAPSQRESRHLGDRLTGHFVLENLTFRAPSPTTLQVEGDDHKIMTVDLPLPLIPELFRNHVIETAPAVTHLKNTEQSTMCSSQEAGVCESCSERGLCGTCSEIGVGDSCSERGLCGTYSEIGVGDFYSERGISEIVGDSCSEIGVGDSYSERGLSDIYSETGRSDTYSELGVGDSYSERGLSDIYSDTGCSDTYSELGVDSQKESQFNCSLPVTSYSPVVTRSRSRCVLHMTRLTRSLSRKVQEAKSPICRCKTCREITVILGKKEKVNRSVSHSKVVRRRRRRRRRRHISGGRCTEQSTMCSSQEAGVDESYSERGLCSTYSEIGVGDSCSERGLCSTYSEIGVGDSCSERGLCSTYSEIGVGDSCSERGLCSTYSEIGVGDSCSERGLCGTYSEVGVGDSCSERGLCSTYSEIGVGDSCSERGLCGTYSEIGVGESCSERGLCGTYSEMGVGESYSERGLCGTYSEIGVGESCSERGLCGTYSEIGVGESCSERGLCGTYSKIGVGDSYSEGGISEIVGDSCSERGLSDIYSETGHSDTYSELGVDSQKESQFNCSLPVTSYSPVVTRSRSRCVLHMTRLTRSLSRKVQEAKSPICRCKTCREITVILGKKEKVNRSVSHSEVVRRRRRRHISGGSCGGTPRRRRSLSASTRKHHSTQNTDRSLAFMNQFRASVQAKSGSGIKQKCYSRRR